MAGQMTKLLHLIAGAFKNLGFALYMAVIFAGMLLLFVPSGIYSLVRKMKSESCGFSGERMIEIE